MYFLGLQNKSGQGLIETIVALGIIVSGIVGIMSLAIQNQTASEYSEERLIATNLAREGVEVVRNIRDTNWLSCEISSGVLSCNDWDQDLYQGTDVTAVPIFDVDNNSWTLNFEPNSINHDYARIFRRSESDAEFIGTQFNSDESSPANSISTGFRRLLEIHSICSDKTVSQSCLEKIGIRVQSTVQWYNRDKINEITVEERLFNWR